jgi:uncharacterized lipoprotein YmbA
MRSRVAWPRGESVDRRGFAAFLGATILTASCVSAPEIHTYTLGTDSATATLRTTASDSQRARPSFLIDIAPVTVPSQVARKQLVLQKDGVRLQVLEQERWSMQPADEIRQRLSANTADTLGTFDISRTPSSANQPVYTVAVDVRRLESWFASHALLDAVWTVKPRSGAAGLVCRSTINVAVGEGFPALANGHQRTVTLLSDEIAAAVRSLEYHTPFPATCLPGKATDHGGPSTGIESAT